MRYLFPIGSRLAQPQGVVRVKWANPITKGLVVLAHPSVGDVITGKLWTRRGTTARVGADVAGIAFKTFYDGGTSDFEIPCNISASGDRTMVAYASNFGNNVANLTIVEASDADSGDGLAIGPSLFGATIDNNGSPTISVGEFSKPRLLAGRRIGNQVYASMDHTFTSGSITGTRSLDTTVFRIGRAAALNSTMTATVYWAGYWNRALTEAELRSLANAPWQLFEEARTIWSPVQALGGGGLNYTMSAGGSFTLSGAVALIKQKVMSASGSIAFSGTRNILRERTMSASGQVALSGSAPFVNTAQYTMSAGGTVNFQGGASLVKQKVLAVSGQVSFGGSAPMVFVPAGGVAAAAPRNIFIGVGAKNRIS